MKFTLLRINIKFVKTKCMIYEKKILKKNYRGMISVKFQDYCKTLLPKKITSNQKIEVMKFIGTVAKHHY